MATKQQHEKLQRITVFIGYVLFLITVIGLIVSLVPWASVANNPMFMHASIVATMIAYALATILPPLVGYFVGGQATRNNSRLIHHYNGVLFGILGFWFVTLLTGSLAFVDVSNLVTSLAANLIFSFVPAIIAVVALIVLGVFYARHTKHQRSLLNYLPYQVLLMLSVASLFIASGVSIAVGSWGGAGFVSSFAALFLPALMIGILVVFGAWVIGSGNGSKWQRLTKSLIAISYGLITMSMVGGLLVYVQAFAPSVASWAFLSGAVVWLVYVILLRRYASIEK